MQSQINNPQSICLLRLSALGDVCHAVATVQAIQQRWPQAKLTWIIGKVEYQLVKDLSGVEFVIFDKKMGFKAYKQLWQQVHHRQFDILLHMQVALRASLATLCIRAKEKWGFDKARAKEGQWLFTNKQIPAQKQAHVAEGFMAFAKAIGVPESQTLSWKMPITEQDRSWLKATINPPQTYVVIAAAASKAERNWLAERYAAVANYIHQQGYQVILCGGPSEMEQTLARNIQAHCNFEATNLVAQTNLQQLLALLEQAQFVIAPDTGPAHMASALNTPVIGLYAHSNPKRTGPYNSQAYVVSEYEQLLVEQTGKNAAQNPWGKRVKGHDLMQRISVEQVISRIESLIKQEGLKA